jgi:hypothetical protein
MADAWRLEYEGEAIRHHLQEAHGREYEPAARGGEDLRRDR